MKILIVTGRTGGHFYPAKTFASALKRRYPDANVHFVLSRGTAENVLEEEISNAGNIHYLPSFPWRGLFQPGIISFLVSLAKAFFQSWKLMKSIKPDLIVGFGSYLAFPVVITGWLARTKILIHEQNVVMGKANRFLLPFVTQVAVSFSDTIKSKFQKKFIVTGNIIRSELIRDARLMKWVKKSGDDFHILVCGGSQGARELNRQVLEAFSNLKESVSKRICVSHLAGIADENRVKEKYVSLGIKADVKSFSRNMSSEYQAADLVISRSGAGTLFELVLFQVPAILIPYPYSGAHQFENADMLVKFGRAWLKAEDLSSQISELIQSPGHLVSVRDRLKDFLKVDDGENLVQVASGLFSSPFFPPPFLRERVG